MRTALKQTPTVQVRVVQGKVRAPPPSISCWFITLPVILCPGSKLHLQNNLQSGHPKLLSDLGLNSFTEARTHAWNDISLSGPPPLQTAHDVGIPAQVGEAPGDNEISHAVWGNIHMKTM